MSEKPDDTFDDDEDDDLVESDGEDTDLDEIFRDLEAAPRRRRSSRSAPEPAWRKLERYLEDRRTADLLADFDDYDVDGAGGGGRKKK